MTQGERTLKPSLIIRSASSITRYVTRFSYSRTMTQAGVQHTVDQVSGRMHALLYLDIFVAKIVDQATRRSDEDVKGAARHGWKLRHPRDAAVRRDRFNPGRLADGFELVEDLHREFAGRREDQSD